MREWDRLVLGPYILPGLARVWVVAAVDVDVSKQKDKLGKPKEPTLTDNGPDPTTIKATVEVFTKKDWEDLTRILPQIKPKKNSTERPAFDITHPAAALLGLQKVIVKGVSVPPPEAQSLTVEITMQEWFPATALPKPVLSSGGRPKADKNANFDNVPTVSPGKNLKK